MPDKVATEGMSHGYLRSCSTCSMLRKYKSFDKTNPESWKYGYMCCLFTLDPRDKVTGINEPALMEIQYPEKRMCEAWTPIREGDA